MKCLKIPNTIHFKDVTTITDALALHEKLMRESQESQFRPDLDEEFEDNEGNILNKRTYTDMKKQGLIDN
jgi:splicing factor 3A subunit 3